MNFAGTLLWYSFTMTLNRHSIRYIEPYRTCFALKQRTRLGKFIYTHKMIDKGPRQWRRFSATLPRAGQRARKNNFSHNKTHTIIYSISAHVRMHGSFIFHGQSNDWCGPFGDKVEDSSTMDSTFFSRKGKKGATFLYWVWNSPLARVTQVSSMIRNSMIRIREWMMDLSSFSPVNAYFIRTSIDVWQNCFLSVFGVNLLELKSIDGPVGSFFNAMFFVWSLFRECMIGWKQSWSFDLVSQKKISVILKQILKYSSWNCSENLFNLCLLNVNFLFISDSFS